LKYCPVTGTAVASSTSAPPELDPALVAEPSPVALVDESPQPTAPAIALRAQHSTTALMRAIIVIVSSWYGSSDPLLMGLTAWGYGDAR
jgi:hypothetical protein